MKKTPQLFDLENEARKRIEFSGRKLPEVKIGEIWWYYVGVNIGQEISKGYPYLRPCLLIQKITNTSLIRIIPLTTKSKKHTEKHLLLIHDHEKLGIKKSWLMTHQISTIDKKRLIKKKTPKSISKYFCKKFY